MKIVGWVSYVHADVVTNIQPVEDDLRRSEDHAYGTLRVCLKSSSGSFRSNPCPTDSITYPPVFLTFVPQDMTLFRQQESKHVSNGV